MQVRPTVALGARAKAMAGSVLMECIGRRNLARIARFLTNTARLDVPNDLHNNGESIVQRCVLKHSPSDHELIVFDVGANIGEWSMQLLNISKERQNSCLYAFEPVTSTMVMLQANLNAIESTWQVTPVQLALSETIGRTEIFVVRDGAGTNAIVPDPREAINRTELVQVSTVDDYCEANGIDEIGLLKVDAEGHDLFVLRGARRLLERKKIHVIQFEYNHRWVWSRVTLFNVFEYAESVGYRIGKVTPKGIEFYDVWHFELERFVEGNYLFCRPDWVDKFPQIAWWNLNRLRPAAAAVAPLSASRREHAEAATPPQRVS
jgi:FkbM family methyltransferase